MSSPSPVHMVAPGGTIGILGGGQLGRMLALAAAELGLKTHIFCPEPQSPAGHIAHAATTAPYDDDAALDRFAKTVDVVTYEFENIPPAALHRLGQTRPIFPAPDALAIAQDRAREKSFLTHAGLRAAPFAEISCHGDLDQAIAQIGCPAVLKTRRLGYDGKGQQVIERAAQAAAAWAALGEAPAILESFITFDREISVIIARGQDGDMACYEVAENIHTRHILNQTIVPARISDPVRQSALDIAARIVTALKYVGIMGIEFFAGPETILVNEIAPRVHNSGHWTLDACPVSQFEQHIRAICGWPLGDADRLANAVMTNLLGEDWQNWRALVARPGACLHLYGKAETRPGRKMGHVTQLLPLDQMPRS